MKNEVIEIKEIEDEVNFGPSTGFAKILYSNGARRNGIFDVNWRDSKIKKNWKVVASACKASANGTGVIGEDVKVLNVVPTNGQLLMRLYIKGEPTEFRIHIIIYY